MSKSRYKKQDMNTLIFLARQGDNFALEELLRRIQKNIFAMFSYLVDKRVDIADLTQESLLKTARNIKNLNSVSKFKSWLNQIVTNVFYDYVKKNAKNRTFNIDENKLLAIKDKIGCEPGEKCLFAEIDKLIKAALMNLPDTLRIAIILREYEGLSYEDIANITNTALGTVKSRIARARIRLQEELKDFM